MRVTLRASRAEDTTVDTRQSEGVAAI